VTPVLVFDIETVPDTDGIRRLQNLSDALSDDDVAELAFHQRRAQTGHDFLPHYLQRVVAISCVLRNGESWKVWSIGTPGDSEATLIQRFFDGVDKFTPQIVSWNGQGFDAQVLHYRGLIHGVVAERYWDQGEDDREFKWNNYISRYHSRHLDLMDLLALYQPRAAAPLDALAKLCGFPGKLGMDGSAVWGAYRAGKIGEIRDYCETDVVNTYLVYLQFQKMRGTLDARAFEREQALVRHTLEGMTQAHWREYLAAWPQAARA
jgi:predicted PolB exonuclease-like 3'-5' exonuclease